MPPNPSEDIRGSQDRGAMSQDEDMIEGKLVERDEDERSNLRRHQQDDADPRQRRQEGGARNGL